MGMIMIYCWYFNLMLYNMGDSHSYVSTQNRIEMISILG